MLPDTSFQSPQLLSLHLPDGAKVYCLDLARVHPVVCGNKYFKLKHLIKLTIDENSSIQTLLTAGGPQSHHLDACWAWAQKMGWHCLFVMPEGSRAHTHGFIQNRWASNPPQVVEISRYQFPLLAENTLDTLADTLPKQNTLRIPFGGSTLEAVKSCRHIAQYMPSDASHISMAVGTGCTFAGVLLGMHDRGLRCPMTGLASFSAQSPIEPSIQHWLAASSTENLSPWTIRYLNQKPFKPFGKPLSQLHWDWFLQTPLGHAFTKWQTTTKGQGLDPVYNEKLWYYWALQHEKGHSLDGLCLVNTGGIAANR